MEQELVSVIMATHDDGLLLEKSIKSVLGQSYNKLELVITDDGSTNPETRRILNNYAQKDSRLKVFFSETNQGAGIARNNSIKHANGQYIAFCDSDDQWKTDKLEKQIKYMKAKDVPICYSSYIRRSADGEEMGIVVAPDRITYRDMRRIDNMGFSTCIFDVRRIGKKFYMPSLRKRQDWALKLEIMHDSPLALGLREALVYYTVRKGSVSHNKLSLVKYHIAVYKLTLGFSTLKSYLMFLFVYMPRYTAKKLRIKSDSRKYFKGTLDLRG